MKKILTLVGVAMLVVSCFTFGWAQQQPSTSAQAPKTEQPVKSVKAEKPLGLVGEIVSVDTTASAVIVKQKSGKMETLKADPKVFISKGGKNIPLNALAPGDKVSVTYKIEAGEKIATRIIERIITEKKVTVSKKPETTPTTK